LALKSCRECGQAVSTEAPTCPHCGAKDHPTRTRRSNGNIALILIGLVSIGYFIATTNLEGEEKKKTSMTPEDYSQLQTCSSDWRKCRDNSQLVNESGVLAQVASSCQTAAGYTGRYGAPSISFWSSFGHYRDGDDYIKTGIVQVGEPRAEYKNQFGGTTVIDVECYYNLNCKSPNFWECIENIVSPTNPELLLPWRKKLD
jgi:hypothetical protein